MHFLLDRHSPCPLAPSFPTRRSSDLASRHRAVVMIAWLGLSVVLVSFELDQAKLYVINAKRFVYSTLVKPLHGLGRIVILWALDHDMAASTPNMDIVGLANLLEVFV